MLIVTEISGQGAYGRFYSESPKDRTEKGRGVVDIRWNSPLSKQKTLRLRLNSLLRSQINRILYELTSGANELRLYELIYPQILRTARHAG